MNNTTAQLYLADQRGRSETELVRSFHVFNTGSYKAPDREPFGPLCLLDDDTLRAGASTKRRVDTDTVAVMLPLMGTVEFATDAAPDFLEPGHAQLLWLPAGASYVVSNPYETETINVLQLWFSGDAAKEIVGSGMTRFDLIQKNTLLPLVNLPGIRAFIGRYDGRAEDTISVGNGLFVFVLSGAFEVANRLLHERDGLALPTQNEDVVAFEALSNDAVLIAISL